MHGRGGAWVLRVGSRRFVAVPANEKRVTSAAWSGLVEGAREKARLRVRAASEPTMLATLALSPGEAAQKLVAELCARDESLRIEAATATALVDACTPAAAPLAKRFLDLGAPVADAAPALLAGVDSKLAKLVETASSSRACAALVEALVSAAPGELGPAAVVAAGCPALAAVACKVLDCVADTAAEGAVVAAAKAALLDPEEPRLASGRGIGPYVHPRGALR